MPNSKPSFIDKLKSKLQRRTARATAGENLVTDIIADTTRKIADSRNLRVQQTILLGQQLQYKADAPIRAEVERAQTLAHRARVRRPLKSALVRNTYTDHEGRMYMDTSNGMLLRVEKPHKSLLLRSLITNKLAQDAKEHDLSLRTEVSPADNAAE